MVEWTDEAVEEALNAYSDSWRCYYEEDNEVCRNRMRAALNAAVKAQGLGDNRLHKDGYPYAKGRSDAFEEISEAIKWRWPDAAAIVDEMAREGK